MSFAERLKKLRLSKSLSQAALAEKLNISKSAVGMYELGARQPDYETLEVIADFFNVDMNYLIGGYSFSNTSHMHVGEETSEYYINSTVAAMAQEMYERPEMKVLFDASRNLNKEDILTVAKLLKKLQNGEED